MGSGSRDKRTSEEIKVIRVFLSDRQSQMAVKVPRKMESSDRAL